MAKRFCNPAPTQWECCSNHNKIYSYPGENQKKRVFAANWFYLCPEFRDFAPKLGWRTKKKNKGFAVTNLNWLRLDYRIYRPLFRLNVQEAFFWCGVAKSWWGTLNLDWETLSFDGETHSPYSFSTAYIYILNRITFELDKHKFISNTKQEQLVFTRICVICNGRESNRYSCEFE